MKRKIRILAIIAFCLFTAAGKIENKPYTIMIYMNGSDLESEFGAATDDLAEMLDSGLDSKNANVLILTGGAKRWMNDAIPEYEVVLWELEDGWLNEVKSMGKVNMGNPKTLQNFISYSMNNYPANKYGLIMWDHGGGSIAGFGHDEKFDDDSLSLLDMQYAFENAGLRENKLEFLGFDACLMATIEMAVLASDYAHTLIASEDLEPGDGWDYIFLNALNENPDICGVQLGVIIVDTFMDFYGLDSDEILSLSVVDLANVSPVMDAMGDLMSRASGILLRPQLLPASSSFRSLAIRRAQTKTFGEGSPRDNYSDMVDIGDMAIRLMDLFPREAETVLDALKNCVLYNRHNSDVDIWGLSTFYIYGGKSLGKPSLQTYSDLEMDAEFTAYLHRFFNRLKQSGNTPQASHTDLALWQPVSARTHRMAGLLQTTCCEGEYLWPKINGHFASFYPITKTASSRFYAIPAEANGRQADIIVVFNDKYPEGKIRGLRNYAGGVIQKGYDPIVKGDEISIYSLHKDVITGEENWHKHEPFTVSTKLYLSWEHAPHDFYVCLRHKDICCNVRYD